LGRAVVLKVYAFGMPSDPRAELADSLEKLAAALRVLVTESRHVAPGSPADKEAEGEPYGGEWGATPSRDVLAAVRLTSWSCADHLAGAVAAVRVPVCVTSPFTLIRAAAESAAIACYLASTAIGPLERVRRYMNWQLDGLCQQVTTIRSFTIPEAASEVQAAELSIQVIARTGMHFGLQFRQQDGPRSAYLGDRLPSAMTLIDECTPHAKGLGVMYQRFLSSVAHAKAHGLRRYLMNDGLIAAAQSGNIEAYSKPHVIAKKKSPRAASNASR
jgi:hypothetical protein